MFVEKLYRHNKWWCAGFVAFITVFLFINIKWGLVASPILQFGMYSGKAHLSDTLTVYKLKVNGEPLDVGTLHTGERDFVQTYLSIYPGYQQNNLRVHNTLSAATGLTFKHPVAMAAPVTDAVFSNWFRQKIETILARKVKSIQVFSQQYTWVGGKLVPLSSAAKLPYLDAH